jgi:hypothetical protein
MKYEVEDGLDVDFFNALKSIESQQPQPLQHSQTNEATCLITSNPLNAFHVTLACGHKFNYEPLYQEVIRQKGRLGMHNYYEKIGMHQIKCPYCRTITNQLLPSIGPHPVIKRLNGVNAPASMCMPGIACSYTSCRVTAFYEYDANPYCLRHYNSASTTNKNTKNTTIAIPVQCAAEIQTGKNKGMQCSLNAVKSDSVPPLCKKHSKCNVVMYKNNAS